MPTEPDGAAPWSVIPGGLRLRLKVTPRAKRAGPAGLVAEADGSARLALRVTEPPADGAANKSVIALVARLTGVPKSAVALTAGGASRLKTVEIAGDPAELASRLAPLVAT